MICLPFGSLNKSPLRLPNARYREPETLKRPQLTGRPLCAEQEQDRKPCCNGLRVLFSGGFV